MLRFLLCDLDDTLYPPQCGLWPAIGRRIDRYLVERLRLPPDQAQPLRQRYLLTYGTTLHGLRLEHAVDPHDFLAFVHDVPLEAYLAPDPRLDRMLARLPLRKVILTNADAPHARRVLARLGLDRHFERIIDIHTLGLVCKPEPQAYVTALALLGAQPGECVFVDDSPRNAAAAHQLGLLAFHVTGGQPAAAANGVAVLDSLLDLEQALRPHLAAAQDAN